jgi:hypothetical protein
MGTTCFPNLAGDWPRFDYYVLEDTITRRLQPYVGTMFSRRGT